METPTPPHTPQPTPQKNYRKLLGVITLLILLAIALTVYVALRFQEQRIDQVIFTYNGFDFKKTPVGNTYLYQITMYINNNTQPTLIRMRNDPRELENIPVQDIAELTALFQHTTQVYVTIDPAQNLTGKTTTAALELDYIIDNPYLYNIPVNSSFTTPLEGHESTPTKTCEDSNDTTRVVWFRTGNTTSVFEENGCIIIQGTDEYKIIQATDAFLYRLLGIIQP